MLSGSAVWERLTAFSVERMPQALLFLGAAGVGKRAHALALYQSHHCEKPLAGKVPCGECLPCGKIARGNHPDLLFIEASGAHIAVDDLREMKTRLHFRPSEGRYRMVVLPEAQKLNGPSANALLKTLEEPPAHTRFVLCATERSLLLPTILSRVQTVAFPALPEGTLRREALARAEARSLTLKPAVLEAVVGLCGDGLSRLDTLLTEAQIGLIERCLAPTGAKALTYSAAAALADELAADDEGLLSTLLDLIVWKAGNDARGAVAAGASPEIVWNMAHEALKAPRISRLLERQANRKLAAFNSTLLWGGP
jgi:DNA polymerase III delta' subunit